MLLLLVALESFGNMAYGQDPGLPDSVILAGDTLVAYNPGIGNFYDLSVFCKTDDSVLFVNIPLKWSGDPSQVYPSGVFWENTFGVWEHFALYSGPGSNRISIFGSVEFGQSGPALYTNYQWELGVLIRFIIAPTAIPQIVVFDTTTDSIGGRIEMANIDITFRPKFRAARFQYGEPGQSIDSGRECPTKFALKANYPNPFNSSTMIEFELSEAARCRLIIYDILGREIAYLIDGELQAGHYSVVWDGKDKAGGNSGSGIYFAKMIINEQVQTRRITLIR